MDTILSPKDFFGFTPGDDRKMIRWDRLVAYYTYLAQHSSRLLLEYMGPTSEGNPFIYLVISSQENLENLDKYCRISRQLADPRGLSDKAIQSLAREGKAICMQSYSLHSNEVAGSQMCPLLVYDLLTAQEGELAEILDKVIFVMVPCAEPDGEIVFTDWYEKYLGTPYEGTVSPYLRHNYAGHSNNRDAIHESVVESKYLIDLLVHRYIPQAFQDHHHQCPQHDRMSISPKCNPIQEFCSPLVYREQAVYGAFMAQTLENAGRKGIVSGDEKFDGYPVSTFYSVGTMHNTAGMLTESADTLIASPLYVYPDQMIGNIHTDVSVQCPSPWEGGWWHLSDVVDQQYWASVGLLHCMAQNRELVLRNMAVKALRQTKRGQDGKEKAYILPIDQQDASTLWRMLDILSEHEVEMYTAQKDFVCDHRFYPAGSVIVPLGQPKYAFVKTVLGSCHSVINRYATSSRESDVNEGYCTWFSKNMGVDAIAAEAFPQVEMTPYVHQAWQEKELPLPGNENASFAVANALLAAGKPLFRDAQGTFYGEDAQGRTRVEAMRIGLVKTSVSCYPENSEEGYCRNLLQKMGFPHRIVMDREFWTGVPDDVDTLILPGHTLAHLLEGDSVPAGKPPEFQSGLGTQGTKNLVSFVENGGRLLAWEFSCAYVAKVFDLPLDVIPAGKDMFTFNGATLAIDLGDDPLCAGMPQKSSTVFLDSPVMKVQIYSWGRTENWKAPVYISQDEPVVLNGRVTGKEQMVGTPCVLRIPYGKGEIILYSFDPKFRMQVDGTYKLFFNALYK